MNSCFLLWLIPALLAVKCDGLITSNVKSLDSCDDKIEQQIIRIGELRKDSLLSKGKLNILSKLDFEGKYLFHFNGASIFKIDIRLNQIVAKFDFQNLSYTNHKMHEASLSIGKNNISFTARKFIDKIQTDSIEIFILNYRLQLVEYLNAPYPRDHPVMFVNLIYKDTTSVIFSERFNQMVEFKNLTNSIGEGYFYETKMNIVLDPVQEKIFVKFCQMDFNDQAKCGINESNKCILRSDSVPGLSSSFKSELAIFDNILFFRNGDIESKVDLKSGAISSSKRTESEIMNRFKDGSYQITGDSLIIYTY